MAKDDRQLERLKHMSGGNQLRSTNYGQNAGTVKASDKAARHGGKRKPN